MPWTTSKTIAEERREFCEKALLHDMPVVKLCRQHGISRKTAYKWIKRYFEGDNLESQSRRPKSSPRATPQEVVDAIVGLRTKHRFLGGAKIAVMLKKRGMQHVPSGTTVTSIIRAHDLLDKQASVNAKHHVRFVKNRSNEMWQMDFKGHFPLLDGTRCHPFTCIDDYSRFSLGAEALLDEKRSTLMPALIRIFREYGLPYSILCDNGSPWGYSSDGGITRFEAWMMELGVLVLHGRPIHPQTQGKDERFNRTLLAEAIKFCDRTNLASVSAGLAEYREFYNHERPHFAIDYKCPADVYMPSSVSYPETIFPWEYPPGSHIRKIDPNGQIHFKGRECYFSSGMIGKRVALVPSTKEGCWNILFRQFIVGRYNQVTNRLEFVRSYLITGDPREGKSFPGL